MARSKRREKLSDAERAVFLEELHRFHSTTCSLLRFLKPGSNDYQFVSALGTSIYATIGALSGNNALWTKR